MASNYLFQNGFLDGAASLGGATVVGSPGSLIGVTSPDALPNTQIFMVTNGITQQPIGTHRRSHLSPPRGVST
jgi:hypothetical protein